MDKHIVIYGPMRSATVWLGRMFRANVLPVKEGDISHEGFKRSSLQDIISRWEQPGVHINVGFDGKIVGELYKHFPDLQLAVVVRDPVAHVISVINHLGGRSFHTFTDYDTGVLMNVAYQWGPVELVLNVANELGIDARVWHFDYYTTSEGFTELGQSLGLEIHSPLRVIKPVNCRKREIHDLEDYPPALPQQIYEMLSKYRLAGPAYAAAKAYADKKLGRSE